MNIDTNDPAYRLAKAAFDSARGDPDAIDRAFNELKPTTKTITRAYVFCLCIPPFYGLEAPRLILNTLQYQLAEKTARRLNVLTGVLVILTLLLIAFGIFDVCMRLNGR